QLGSGWAPRGLSAALGALRGPAGGLDPPSRGRRSGRVVAVHSVLPSGGAAGVAVGAHVLELNGQPFLPLAHRSRGALRPGVVNHYVFERPDGERFARDLAPVPCAENRSEVDVLVHALLLLVALIYRGTGTIVYWLRPDRSGAWALLLFCSALSVQLAITLASDQISGADFHLVLNAPLIGATTFHLFTTYPSEPGWVGRRRRGQVLPYVGAAPAAALCFVEQRHGLRPAPLAQSACARVAAGDPRRRVAAPPRRPAARGDGPRDARRGRELRPGARRLPRRVDDAEALPVLPRAALDLRLPGRGRLRDRLPPALRPAQRRALLGRVRRRIDRDHRRLRLPDHL